MMIVASLIASLNEIMILEEADASLKIRLRETFQLCELPGDCDPHVSLNQLD